MIGLIACIAVLFVFRLGRNWIAREIIGLPAPGGPDAPRPVICVPDFNKCPLPCKEHGELKKSAAVSEDNYKELWKELKETRKDLTGRLDHLCDGQNQIVLALAQNGFQIPAGRTGHNP